MVIYGKINFKEAIIVDEKLLRELEVVILEFFSNVVYTCTLCNEDRIDFSSLEELLGYENMSKRKIERLKLSFGYYNELVFEKTFSFCSSYKNTVTCEFSSEDYNSSILFQEKIKNILEKGKREWWYTAISKITMLHFAIAFLNLGIFLNLREFFLKGVAAFSEEVFHISALTIIIFFLVYFVTIIMSKFRERLIPAISFMIGEQIGQIKKGEELFSKFFWGVIVAFIVSVITTLIL